MSLVGDVSEATPTDRQKIPAHGDLCHIVAYRFIVQEVSDHEF